VVGAPIFAQAKPPQFLRSSEVQRLFAHLELSSPSDLRTYAMVHLAYTLGLRPKEISLISLDALSFAKAELTLTNRKNTNPLTLPLPEATLKAIAAYLIGGRPKSNKRTVFLSLQAPYRPITPSVVSHFIRRCMRKAVLPSSAYWLRHTYAQNLLEAGVSLFEIKEMLGHESIESTRKYLHIHTELMREVLFDETL
jgi:site-specific recombinase XerD